MHLALRFGLGAALLAFFACSETERTTQIDAGVSSDSGAESRDAGAMDANAVDASGDTGTKDTGDAGEPLCTPIAQQGKAVTVSMGAGEAPLGTGGGIADGVYTRTSVKKYGDPPVSATEPPLTLSVTSTSFSVVIGTGAGEARLVVNYRSREQYMFFKVYCSTDANTIGLEYGASYTGAATSFTLYTEPTDGTTGIVETTYTKL